MHSPFEKGLIDLHLFLSHHTSGNQVDYDIMPFQIGWSVQGYSIKLPTIELSHLNIPRLVLTGFFHLAC